MTKIENSNLSSLLNLKVERLLSLFHLKRIGLQNTPAEKKAKRRHSRRHPTAPTLETDSGRTFRREAALSFGNPLSPAAGIAACHVPAVCGTHDQIATELESHTHNACALWKSSSSAHRQGKLHEETKDVDISLDLGDYIPLSSSPGCCDIEVNINAKPGVKALYSDSPDKRTSAFSRIKLCLDSAAQENEVKSRTANQYSTDFTGAELLPKVVQEEDDKAFETEESVSEILEKLEKCRHNWMKIRKTGLTKSFEDRDTSVSQRTSVFSRLSFASRATERENNASVFSRLNFVSQVYFNDQVNTTSANSRICMKGASSGSNKRRRGVCPANQDTGPSSGRRVNMNMLDEEYAVTEDPSSWGWNSERDFRSEL